MEKEKKDSIKLKNFLLKLMWGYIYILIMGIVNEVGMNENVMLIIIVVEKVFKFCIEKKIRLMLIFLL